MADKFLNGVKVVELGSDPSSPASGTQIIYPKTDGKFYAKNSAGIVTEITNVLSSFDVLRLQTILNNI